jgi:hypothetical protein
MDARPFLVGLSAATITAAIACASGEGVPTAEIGNDLNLCMVEANYLGYGFADAIGKTGTTRTQEVKVGTGVAYAVLHAAGNCYDAARMPGGILYVSRDQYSAKPGAKTTIRFTDATTRRIDRDCSAGTEFLYAARYFDRIAQQCAANYNPDASADAATE